MKKLLKGDTLPGLVAVCFGLIVVILTLTGENKAILVTKKRGVVPGPGFFAFFCGLLTVAFGALLVLKGLGQNGAVSVKNSQPAVFSLCNKGKRIARWH